MERFYTFLPSLSQVRRGTATQARFSTPLAIIVSTLWRRLNVTRCQVCHIGSQPEPTNSNLCRSRAQRWDAHGN
jgi:hypothetical protein